MYNTTVYHYELCRALCVLFLMETKYVLYLHGRLFTDDSIKENCRHESAYFYRTAVAAFNVALLKETNSPETHYNMFCDTVTGGGNEFIQIAADKIRLMTYMFLDHGGMYSCNNHTVYPYSEFFHVDD